MSKSNTRETLADLGDVDRVDHALHVDGATIAQTVGADATGTHSAQLPVTPTVTVTPPLAAAPAATIDTTPTPAVSTMPIVDTTPPAAAAIGTAQTARSDAARRIITTLVMCGDAYVPGAIALAMSLRTQDVAGMELWCMRTRDVSVSACAALAKFYDRVVEVPYIEYPVIKMRSRKQRAIYGNWIHQSFTKWNIFDDTIFPRGSAVMLMDADMIVRAGCAGDIATLFDLAPRRGCAAATFSSPWCAPFAETRMSLPYSVTHGEIVDSECIERGLAGSVVMIASLVVVRPERRLFVLMRLVLRSRARYGHAGCVSGFDEQLLAEFTTLGGVEWRNVHQSYNWFAGKGAWLEGYTARTIHYYGEKPWLKRRREWLDEAEWWSAAATALPRLSPQEVAALFPQFCPGRAASLGWH
jgi:hypothetical protein